MNVWRDFRIFNKKWWLQNIQKNRNINQYLVGALERVSNDESVLELSEDLGRIFSITRCLSNKTQCQLCKRLAWPILPHSWPGLVWKRLWSVITIGRSAAVFLCIRPFLAWWQTIVQKNNRDLSASLLLTVLLKIAIYCPQGSGTLRQQLSI